MQPHNVSKALITSVISLILIVGFLVWFHYYTPQIPPSIDQQLDDTLQINQGRIPQGAGDTAQGPFSRCPYETDTVIDGRHVVKTPAVIVDHGYFYTWACDTLWYSKDGSSWSKGWAPPSAPPAPPTKYFLVTYETQELTTDHSITGNIWFSVPGFFNKCYLDSMVYHDLPRKKRCYQHVLVLSIHEFKDSAEFYKYDQGFKGDKSPKKQKDCCVDMRQSSEPGGHLSFSDLSIDSLVKSLADSPKAIMTVYKEPDSMTFSRWMFSPKTFEDPKDLREEIYMHGSGPIAAGYILGKDTIINDSAACIRILLGEVMKKGGKP